MAKQSIILPAPNAAPLTRDVVLEGKTIKVFDDTTMRCCITPQQLAGGQIDGNALVALSSQSGETQAILHMLIRELIDQGVLKVPPPPPGDDVVGKPSVQDAFDALMGAIDETATGEGLSDQERADAERETVRDPLGKDEA